MEDSNTQPQQGTPQPPITQSGATGGIPQNDASSAQNVGITTNTQANSQQTNQGSTQQDAAVSDDIAKAKEAAPDPSSILGDDKSFFQDPFIDPNSTAFDEKKNQILQMQIPPHATNFDEKEFLNLVATSISLTFNEKKQIILSIPRLTQFQIDELLKILRDEQKKFKELNEKHLKKLKELEDKSAASSETLEQKTERLMKEQQDKAQADDLLSEIQDL